MKTVTYWRTGDAPVLILEGTAEETRALAQACFGDEVFATATHEAGTMDDAAFAALEEWEP